MRGVSARKMATILKTTDTSTGTLHDNVIAIRQLPENNLRSLSPSTMTQTFRAPKGPW